MATSELRFSLHFVNKSSHPLQRGSSETIEPYMPKHIPNETALVLIINEVQGIVGPGLSYLLQEFFQSELLTLNKN